MSARAGGEPQTIGEIVGRLPIEELRTVLLSAVDRHPDVERHVRLAAARASGDLAGLRGEVDRGLRTRRFLSYRESSDGHELRNRSSMSCASSWSARRRGTSSCCSSARSGTS